jgi:putative FmdB family regulatory protein
MPKYGYACPDCGVHFDLERPMSESSEPGPCPVCATPSPRVIAAPKLLFKADPKDVTPVWHNHGGYSHAHAPRRGRHRTPSEDH